MLRLALAVLAALLLLAAPAQAQEKVCHGQLAPQAEPTEEQRRQDDLDLFAAQRAEFGFRHDLPYVAELVRRGVWEYDVGYIPVTPAENRYLMLRDKLTLGVKAEAYLRKYRDVAGGLSVEDDWPREPYLLVRFKRDVAKHLRALRKVARYPDNLRATRVQYSERELTRINNQIWRDAKQLRAEGFIVTGTGTSSTHAEVDLITKRADGPEYFRKRYGAGVKVHVDASEEYRLVCEKGTAFEFASDGTTLSVHWEGGGSSEFHHFELVEHADRVEVGVVTTKFNGFETADLRFEQDPVTLSAPLGDRMVIDAASGKRLRQVGPSPGEPPCPVAVEPTRFEQALEDRREKGLRADPAYVQHRLNSLAFYTRAELRWLQKVEALDEISSKVYAYVRKHADEYGGTTVVASYPATPYRVFRFTRDAPTHERALRRLTRQRLRTQTVNYTEAGLERLQKQIETDAQAGDGFLDGYGDAGFDVRSAYADDDAGTVDVRVATPRSDAAAYFATRYGPLVRVEVVSDRYECRASRFG